MIKLRTSIKPLTVAITSAILFATLQTYAAPGDPAGVENPYVETSAKRVKQDYPPGSMEQWLANPDQYALNPVNIRAGKHPDRADPNGGPYDVIYIFPDEATAKAWWDPEADPDAPMPTTIPDTAVAFVHWVLDNGSGTFPGIMSKSDIDGFKSKNCIMASGATIPVPGDKDGEEKSCSNPQGSSKRFKMNVLKADTDIDLVYNVETAPLTYNNYETLPTHDGIEESGRIYRILQKWHNATGMDAVDSNGVKVERNGNRIVGFSMELGYGVGSAFNAIPNATTDGLAPDKTLGYELRPCMADHFFDVKRDRPGTGTNDCAETFDSTGQAIPQEIWLEEEYSTFSPKMFSFNTDKRTTPIGGWWDKRPAGIYPPETQTLGKMDSGTANSSDYYPPTNADRTDGGVLNATAYRGATTGNYFNMVEAQAAGYIPDLTLDTNGVIDIPSPFGYLMYYGVLADGDLGILAHTITEDEDGDPATEGDIKAWWDGDEYRWGSDPTYDGNIDEDAFSVVPRETLVEWAMFPLQEEPDPDTGEFPTGPLYEHGLTDDLAGVNVDSFVYLGRNFNAEPVSGNTNFTIRLKAVSVETGLGYTGGEVGNEMPAWVASPGKDLVEYINNDGVIVIRTDIAGQPIIVNLADIVAGSLPTAVVENLRSGETENVTLLQDPDDGRLFSVSLPTAANGNVGTSNDGTLNVWPLDLIQVTYIDEVVEAPAIAPVIRTDVAEIPLETLEPVPPAEDSSGCSCSTSPDGSVDPILPAAVLFALGYLGLRRREERSK